ncbi:ABC-type multidrug transport system ATPase subunit [Haloferula luteola]|uniref:ABC-type multidrug transport system ATPase subunit n=1 Tax=Haloferula luteola TaxID=595692 RepID=A0A840VE33_9BACT|nr:ATP-binding cassette domain-containing protein [Haloferula luteola]MBB5352089.1 ABC-type multidrug transport system ATPase subunit [Haloferula luteola]
MPDRSDDAPAPSSSLPKPRKRRFGRRAEGSASGRVLGLMVDAFAGFATLDGKLDPGEAELILDLLRSAFPEADHSWLARRVRRAVREPRPLPNIAAELRELLSDPEKIAVGLQLYTLVDAVGRSERSRAAFEIFMRRLGRPDQGRQILDEMNGQGIQGPASFERVIFGHGSQVDVLLPAVSADHEFRVYRVADLILVRNTGQAPLWVRGRSLEPGNFLRMRPRQQLVVPGWTLTCEDLLFFLNVALTGNPSTIFLASTDEGWISERSRSRQSTIRIRFGLSAEVEALKKCSAVVEGIGPLIPEKPLQCTHHDRIHGEHGFSASLDILRRRAAEAGGRFRLHADQRDFRISNDPSVIERGDLLLSPGLAPRVVLRVRFDPERQRGDVFVRESSGPVLADGVPVRASAELREGSVIRLSRTQALRCRFREGIIDEERNLIEVLRVEDLLHHFVRDQRALDNLSFEVRRGEVMCIIGPSGSGKSTLMSILAGHRKPTRGRVMLNESSLYEHRERLLPFIAHMPQEEALNPQLTVREHLRHATAIRRASLPANEIERRADSILAELGLQGLARRRVGAPGEKTLSGGERSRLNLGLDLGSAAELFLFDEPISGLSSKDSEHVAETLRSLARDKIVIASLHRPGANVLRLCDKVLLLDTGGRLAYFGSPREMIQYFRRACDELAIQHPSIEARIPLGADFVFDVLETPLAQIGGGQNPTGARRFPPTFWQERFESRVLVRSLGSKGTPPSRIESLPDLSGKGVTTFRRGRSTLSANLRVFRTQFHRAIWSKLRNRGTLYATLIESPLLAALIAITLRSSPQGAYEFSTALHIPAYLFLSATVAMFLGLTNSATEILRDRPILRRERNTRRSMILYVFAKFAALSLVAAVQCFIYTFLGHHLLEIHGTLIDQWQWMTLTACTGTALALLVSAVAKTERGALTAVPLLLVPQMLLAGALVPFREMNRGLFTDASIERERGGIPVPARYIPLRFAYEGMVVTQATRNPFDLERIRIQRRIDTFKELPPPLEPGIEERFDIMKGALQSLVGADAINPTDAMRRASSLTEIARSGTRLELDAFPVRPDHPGARPLSDYFVNKRVELMIEEARAFRTDYRNAEIGRETDIFLSDKKPWFGRQVSTIQFSALVLFVTINASCGLATLALIIQNRRTS